MACFNDLIFEGEVGLLPILKRRLLQVSAFEAGTEPMISIVNSVLKADPPKRVAEQTLS